MASESLPDLFRRNERLAILVNHVVVSLMLACAAAAVVQLGEALQPAWNGNYLVVFGFLVALEAMYSERVMNEYEFFSPEWLFYRAAEWVVILVLLKLVMYAVNGFDQLWIDLPLWRDNFVDNFFTGEYFFAAFIALFIWILAGIFSYELIQLEGDEKLLAMERDSGIALQRAAIRRSLAGLILFIGATITIIAGFIFLEMRTKGMDLRGFEGKVANLLVYFLLSLVLLSLTQFSILRAQWGLERVPIHVNLGSRWVTYSLLFLAALAVIAALLPTHYSVGLLEILGYVLSIFLLLFDVFVYLMSIPFLLLVYLFSLILGKAERPTEDMPLLPNFPEPRRFESAAPMNEVIKSLIFWLLFGGIIILSIRHYLLQNQALASQIKKLRVLQMFAGLWRSLRGWLTGVNQRLAAAVEAGRQRILERRRSQQETQRWGFINLRRLSPRQKVMFYYLAMVRRGGESGVPRDPAATPYEYSDTLKGRVAEAQGEVDTLTGEFVEARYSRHEITADDAGLVQRAWQRIQKTLRGKKNTGAG